jgi:hypothetical protein
MRRRSSDDHHFERPRRTSYLPWRLADFAEILSAQIEILEKDAARSTRITMVETRLETHRRRNKAGDREP